MTPEQYEKRWGHAEPYIVITWKGAFAGSPMKHYQMEYFPPQIDRAAKYISDLPSGSNWLIVVFTGDFFISAGGMVVGVTSDIKKHYLVDDARPHHIEGDEQGNLSFLSLQKILIEKGFLT